MQYASITFPPRLALSIQRVSKWQTRVTQSTSGRVGTQQDWQDALHTYDASFAVRTDSDYDEIVQHFHAVRGRAKKWPLKDPLDYKVTTSRSAMTELSADLYQLGKTYGTGADVWTRRITRPIAGTVAVYRLRTGVTTDITADGTLDAGLGTFEADALVIEEGDVLTWSGQFYVPCMYGSDRLPGQVAGKRPGTSGELLVQCDDILIEEVLE